MSSELPNSKRPGSMDEKKLVETLGNPHASESEWINASANLGEYKPKATHTERQARRTKVLSVVALIAAVGLGGFGINSLINPSHIAALTPVTAPVVTAPRADVDFGPYMANLQRNIKHSWHPPKGNESKRVVVLFKIHKNGQLTNLRIDHSSGLAIADQAALRAIETAAANFHALPEGASDDVDIQFTFDYNVFSGKYQHPFKDAPVQPDEHQGGSDAFSSSADVGYVAN
jgi:TonB family protein